MDQNKINLDRRSFVRVNAKAAALLSLAPSFALAAPKKEGARLRVAMVGTGIRSLRAWGIELVEPYKEYMEMVGLCDINEKRAKNFREIVGLDAKVYPADQFDGMVAEQKPDMVLVTTTDSAHAEYIIRAMELGCDVISEKPIAIDEVQCQNILDAEKKYGKKVYVGFNVRYMNDSVEMKRVLDSGALGKIISIEFQEYLDTDHGASYFRRWHGKNKYSGSLFVHKSSHHFDLVNWLLDAAPIQVSAMGSVSFYGSNNDFRGKNCRNCNYTDQCDFYWDITKNETLKKLYVDCEDVDQYYRDGCVWDEKIDSPDSGSVLVQYDNGAYLNYTLNAYLPYEGQYISFSGENGRLDVRIYYNQPWSDEVKTEFRLTKDKKTSKAWTISPDVGAHGGADKRVKDNLFKPNQEDTSGQRAGSRAGVLSSLVGIAALKSIQEGKAIKIDNLITL
ncbi:Gfo/Idh/MocA family protein [Flagellimonas marina]|uniref:Gfo/Idh/MocA family protein n=1 Tax=Flagellimonas marina TaxID=1775168 RepID=A0ABV8PM80_9FLAO